MFQEVGNKWATQKIKYKKTKTKSFLTKKWKLLGRDLSC